LMAAGCAKVFKEKVSGAKTVNAGVKIPRFAGEKIHQCCWQEGPELGAFS
jgi:hypothetical protein